MHWYCQSDLSAHLTRDVLTRFAGFYNTGWFGGSIPAAAITFGTNYIDNDYSWRIPLILQCSTCLLVIVAVFFIPESPRWMVANGRDEEATAFLAKYHGNGNLQSRLVLLELEEMKEGIKQDGIDKTKFNCECINLFGRVPNPIHLFSGC